MNGFMADKIGTIIADIYKLLPMLLTSCGICFVLGLLWMEMMKACARILAIFSIVLVVVGSALLGFFMWTHAEKYKKGTQSFDEMKGGAIVVWVVDGLFVLLMLCFHKALLEALSVI